MSSWNDTRTRDAITSFVERVTTDGPDFVPPVERVAVFDNDGTLWCEKPNYVQFDFFVDALRARAADDPSLGERPELDAVLRGDMAAVGEMGLERVAVALVGLFDGATPDEFGAAVDEFVDRHRHPTLGTSVAGIVYQPMLELLDALRAAQFTVGVVTGGGTEFVRRISGDLYGVGPEMVVGSLIGYELGRDDEDRPRLTRTVQRLGEANEGGPKVAHIQAQIGRAPIFAAGNSAGDREMLEWACAGRHPGLAVLVDHDDAEREFAYESVAATFASAEKITDVAARLGWVTVSMQRDWATIFAG
jgi:phosphoserine phosphatase